MGKIIGRIMKIGTTRNDVPVLFDNIITGGAKIQDSKSVEYTENGEYVVNPDKGYDAVAQVNVTVDTPVGPVIPINPGYVDTLVELADYAKVCNVYGAVLSTEIAGEHTGKYIIWNDDPDNREWDPSAIEDTPVVPSGHGTNIAICIGDGVWVMTGWIGLTNSLMFADSDTDLYNTFLSGCVKGSGKDNSDYILVNYGTDPDVATKYPLWNALKTLRQTYTGTYIPNSQELRTICFKLATVPSELGSFEYDTNIAKVFGVDTNYYWSSSQYVSDIGSTNTGDFESGYLNSEDKGSDYYSFAVLSFD